MKGSRKSYDIARGQLSPGGANVKAGAADTSTVQKCIDRPGLP